MNVVVLDGNTINPGDLSWTPISRLCNFFKVYSYTDREQIIERCQNADAILTNKIEISKQHIDFLPRLRYIGITATGYNGIIDKSVAINKSLTVCNVPNYSTESVAQMVFAHILAVTNKVEHYNLLNKSGRWSSNDQFCYWDQSSFELLGKTIGIIGLGNIGLAVARIAKAFGMNVLAFTSKKEDDIFPFILKTDLTSLLERSDVISLHCPLTEKNVGLISKKQLDMIKPQAILINTARGALINEADVADALTKRTLYAYCGDVMTHEPPAENNQLLNHPFSYITPHIAWATIEARKRLIQICADNLQHYMNGNPQNLVF